MRRRASNPPERDHGSHTLRVWEGMIVGRNGDDVFVELGERMQGVVSAREFDDAPRIGEVHEFTLRGQEESLWVLSRRETRSLATWENMEVGSLVHVRVVRAKPGGLEVKIGPLHAFLPRSQTGLGRDKRPTRLVGKVLPCEVIEIDRERQRVVVSRKLVLKRERESPAHRRVASLEAGKIVHGRVTRIEDYGVFLRFGNGLEGLIHISNLAHDRLGHPEEVVALGDRLDAKVLYVNRGGKRIGLGVKQLDEDPWEDFARAHGPDDIVEGTVVKITEYGAFVRVAPGVEGLLHRSETGLGPSQPLRGPLLEGQPISTRIQVVDADRQRLSLSLLHADGSRIAEGEAEALRHFENHADDVLSEAPRPTLGSLLSEALGDRDDPSAERPG